MAWERMPEPRPRLTLEIFTPSGQEQVFYLGPHAPRLTPKEIDLLHKIWLDVGDRLPDKEIHHHDIVHFALSEIERGIRERRQRRRRDRASAGTFERNPRPAAKFLTNRPSAVPRRLELGFDAARNPAAAQYPMCRFTHLFYRFCRALLRVLRYDSVVRKRDNTALNLGKHASYP